MFKRHINYHNEKSLAFKLRQRRARHIMALIRQCYDQFGEVQIIDLGGTAYYWKLFSEEFLDAHKVQITVLNTHMPHGHDRMPPRFRFVMGDGCHMPQFNDQQFHLAHSNSVIEHVGGGERIRLFAAEMQRVAHYIYLQTPNFWFPFEPHALRFFFHWLPKTWQARLLMRSTLGWLKKQPDYPAAITLVEHNTLLTPRQVKSLFPHHKIHYEWFGPLIKSIIVQ
jgi:hypothetical protein